MAGPRQALPESSNQLIFRGRMIQFALMGSVLIYGLVVHLLHLEGEPTIEDPEGIQMIFSILGIGSCFVAYLAHRFLLKPERLGDTRDADRFNGRVFVSFIITWAIAETCAVFGLVLSMLLKNPEIYTTFGMLAFLTILAHPITEGRLRALMT